MRNSIKKRLNENDLQWVEDLLSVDYFVLPKEMISVGTKIIIDGYDEVDDDAMVWKMDSGSIIGIENYDGNGVFLVKFDDWSHPNNDDIIELSDPMWKNYKEDCYKYRCWSFMVDKDKFNESRSLKYYTPNPRHQIKEEMIRKEIKMDLPESILKMNRIFKENGHELYVVGGAVRDILTNNEPKDFDLATDATPEKVKSMLRMYRTIDTGEQFSIVNVVTEDGQYEIATFRKDLGKGRRPDSVEHTTIDQDVLRRDLTMNALFYDINKGEIVDLVGGIGDIESNIVRTVGSASERFDEDKLRILRALRFSARVGSELDKDIIDAITKDKTPISGNGLPLSQERIRDEFLKGIKQAQSVGYFTQMIDRHNLWDWIFGRLVVTIEPLLETKNPLILIASLLRSNEPKLIERTLVNTLKYTSNESKEISFLIQFLGINSSNAFKLREKYEIIGMDENTLTDFARFNDMDMKLVDSFLKYRITTSGDELKKQGLIGKDIGIEKERKEKENFERIMNESKIKIAYSGIVLTEKSRNELLQYIEVPKNDLFSTWEILAHHMTINMGKLKDEYKPLLGQTFDLLVTHIGETNNVVAVRVDTEFKTKNKDPHITVAINKSEGGKPAMANEITSWIPIFPFEVEGVLSEVPF